MRSSKPLTIGMSLSPTWLAPEATTHALFDSALYVDVARRAEAAMLDFIFKPDSLTVSAARDRHAPKQGSLDPLALLAVLAHVTRHIGLVATVSTTFVHPYLIARQIQSLHWLSQGRAGWNIVTSLEGADIFGLDALPSADARYARAREATQLVQALWRSHDASGQRHPIHHRGAYFSCDGVLNIAQHPAGLPPLFQAGASSTGRDFAAAFAHAIFAATPDSDAALALKTDLCARAQAQGRDSRAVRVLPGAYLFLAESHDAALALYEHTQARIPRANRLRAFNALLGTSDFDIDDATIVTPAHLPPEHTPTRSRTHSALLRRLIAREALSFGELLMRPEVCASGHWLIIGTAEEALSEITRWHNAGAIDGFIALPGGSEDSYQRFFSELMPCLRDAGLARHAYEGSTLIDHLNIK